MASAITKITEAPSTTIATREQKERKSAIAAMEEPLPHEGPLTPDDRPLGMSSPRGGKRRKRKTKRRKRKSRKSKRRKTKRRKTRRKKKRKSRRRKSRSRRR